MMTHIVYLVLVIPLVLGGLFYQNAADAAVYKWVDERGVAHYANTPPAAGDYTVIQSVPSTYPGQKPPTPKAAPTPPKQPKQAKPAEVSVPQVDEEKCRQVAAEIEKLSAMESIRLKTGETTKLLTEEEKQALIDERRQWHKNYCQ